MILIFKYGLYEHNTVTAMAGFINASIIAVGVVIWPLKYHITVNIAGKKDGASAEEGTPPEPEPEPEP